MSLQSLPVLDRILKIIEQAVNFIFGFAVGYRMGKRKEIELENKIHEMEVDKKLDGVRQDVEDRDRGKSDRDVVDDLLGRKNK